MEVKNAGGMENGWMDGSLRNSLSSFFHTSFDRGLRGAALFREQATYLAGAFSHRGLRP